MKKMFYACLILSVALAFTSCRVFKKKNKCNSCPTWDQLEDVNASLEADEEFCY